MAERRLRTATRKKRERAKFWDKNGEKIRLGLIGGAIIIFAVWIARSALGS
jgi:hypothetical protein